MKEEVRRGVRHIRRADPVLGEVIDAVGDCALKPSNRGFASLGQAILHQQLAIAAARTIEKRFLDQCDPAGRWPDAEQVLRITPARFRKAGVSRQKSTYLLDLARHVREGRLDLRALRRKDDEEVITSLTAVKGIGRWTAEMHLIFALGRLDVLPVDDLGIRNAMRDLYRMRSAPKPARMQKVAAPWRPYRSIACWYLWRHRRILMEEA